MQVSKTRVPSHKNRLVRIKPSRGDHRSIVMQDHKNKIAEILNQQKGNVVPQGRLGRKNKGRALINQRTYRPDSQRTSSRQMGRLQLGPIRAVQGRLPPMDSDLAQRIKQLCINHQKEESKPAVPGRVKFGLTSGSQD